jgi:hypothetical protein
MIVQDRIAAAERYRLQREAERAASEPDGYDAVIVRLAGECDDTALRRLAVRTGAVELRAPVLVAEAGGRMLAARSLADGRAVADPRRHTAQLAELLALRAVHLRAPAAAPKRSRFRRRLRFGRQTGSLVDDHVGPRFQPERLGR